MQSYKAFLHSFIYKKILVASRKEFSGDLVYCVNSASN